MGPRFYERGKTDEMNAQTLIQFELQWGRVQKNAESIDAAGEAVWTITLQWGRAPTNAE